MYCIYCKKESQEKFCTKCGHKNISSEQEWKKWESVYSSYSKGKLEEIISNKDEYREDAVAAAMYMNDNYIHDEQKKAGSTEKKIWYYAYEGESRGPIITSELIAMYEQGVMQDTSVVWRSGFSDWVRLDQAGINLPNTRINTPPPVKAKNMKNGFVVFLMFVPLISTLIQFLLAGVLSIEVTKLWWVAFGLNTLCCALDCSRVKKAGYNTDKLMAAFVLFVPLYIYKRMQLVKGNKWIATIIWIVIFAVDLLVPSAFWVKVIGISNPSMITSVQEGSFYSYPSVEVEQLFDATIKECKWETYMGPNRGIFVRMRGLLDNYNLDIVFKMNMDNSFRISSMRVDHQSCTNEQVNEVLEYIFESYEK